MAPPDGEERAKAPPPDDDGFDEAVEEGAAPWMATFADLMSLLLCFFVLLLSFANMDVIKFREMLGSMKDAFGVQRETPGDFQARSTSLVELSNTEAQPLIEVELAPEEGQKIDRELAERVETFIREEDLSGIVEAVPGERGVTIRVRGALMFELASAEIRREAIPVLNRIAELAEAYPYRIAVEGHTDDVPIHTERFPSNWELSTARAVAGVRYLVDERDLDAARVGASGFADTRPLTRVDDPEEKARNRRIEFVFYRDEKPAWRRVPSLIFSESEEELEAGRQTAPR